MEANGKGGDQGIAWVIMGVCGCGKSQTGSRLAARLGAPFIEGDDYHSAANVAKMKAGVPLTDEDRQGWLEALRDELAGRGGQGAVLSCSSLKRAYRDILRGAGDVRFVHLAGERGLIAERMGARPGHYMPTSLLDSQMASLEPLQPDETGITLDIRDTPERLVEQILAYSAGMRL
ncbi:gluconokinase [Massilia niastensis]|uniref:gluconokinase n=1 Tax=Massilia niastensis TaxID=544911 RepID=UPI000361877A|nr:gluconokinase [Massilia niastensis]